MSQNENPNIRADDSDEPKAGRVILPVWMVVLCGALFYWSQLYLDAHAGGFNKDVYAPFYSYEAVDAAQQKDPNAQMLAKGKAIFNVTCAACHQPNGSGKEGQYPQLAGSDWIGAPGPQRVIRIVLDGITGPVTVSGKQYDFGSTVMTPFRAVYSNDEDLAAVISYVRKTFGNVTQPVTPQEVKQIRNATAAHTGTYWKPEQLLQVPLK